MKISAVKLYENGFMSQPFAFGGEGMDGVDPSVRYLSTHTSLGYENLEAKAIVDLDNPPESKPVGEIVIKEASGKYICSVCGYVYDPAEHDGVAFEDLPEDWKCPRCKQPKDKFNKA